MLGRCLLTLCAVAAVAFVAACGGDDAAESPAATLQSVVTTEATTTTTTLTVEEEVEAAYLLSWEIYTEAVRTFDTSRLEEAYAAEALDVVRDEVSRLRSENTPIVVQIEHDFDLTVDGDVAEVVDTYVNRNYRVDGDNGQPIDDPNDPGTYVEAYSMRKEGGAWRVVRIERRSYSPS